MEGGFPVCVKGREKELFVNFSCSIDLLFNIRISECPSLTDIADGVTTQYKTIAEFTCNSDDFYLDGSATISCL